MERGPSSRKNHLDLIEWMVKMLEKKNHRVTHADHPKLNHPRPDKEVNHIPDIVSRLNGIRYITEAETCDSINHPHTESQWKEFHRANSRFLIVVPNSCKEDAKQKARELGVDAEIY